MVERPGGAPFVLTPVPAGTWQRLPPAEERGDPWPAWAVWDLGDIRVPPAPPVPPEAVQPPSPAPVEAPR
jgi:hypothetical protein